jgi:predicted transport protein
MEKGLEEKTGKCLAEWIDIIKSTGLEKHGEIMKFLKGNHSLTHGYANFVSLKARGADAGSHNDDDLLATQYAKKMDLKPIYERLVDAITDLGTDIELVPKKANVSCRRKKQFALIQPSTKTRIDLGLKLKTLDPSGRLEDSGPFGAMCTHRIQITDVAQIDAELIDWIKIAYEEAG